ncbi:rod shape-determining protein RodA [Patescibacteria group bacterium]
MKLLAKLDWLILLPTLFISSLGILILLSIDPKLATSQLIFFIIGLVGYFIVARIDFRIYTNLTLVFYILSLVLLVITFILGRVTRGSVRWIQIGSLSFQSSEFIKPLLIVSFAGFASKLDFGKIKNILVFLLILLIPNFLIFKQPDLGNSLVFLSIWLAIIYSAGLKNIFVFGGLTVFTVTLPLLVKLLKPYQLERITTFLNPQYDPLGSGYHLLQSIMTIGSGLFIGKGLGMGSQSQLRFLPERHTDFIFASFAEELGFVGASILLLLYFVLFIGILKTAQKASGKFATLICIGIFSMLFFQFFINVGMNLGLVPITGITLPLFSSGGSSLVASLISLGLIQSISRFSKNKESMIEIR